VPVSGANRMRAPPRRHPGRWPRRRLDPGRDPPPPAGPSRDALRAISDATRAGYDNDSQELCQEARRAIDRAQSVKSPDSQEEMDQRADHVDGGLDGDSCDCRCERCALPI
jgi:hypothetical protein